MNLQKIPYEISVWEDVYTLVDEYGNEYEYKPANINIKDSYFKEKKIMIIGAHDLETPAAIFSPALNRKVDGTNVLTFSIYSKYYDKKSDALVKNPYISYLTNERKIKLKFYEKGKIKWLDFIIKDIQEQSENFLINYTATDLFINELSKSGLNLVFENELENNMGTVNELGAVVLKGTDWRIGDDTEVIKQYQEEALYAIKLRQAILATNVLSKEGVNIPQGATIYGFYSSVTNHETAFQFLYSYSGYDVDENNVIINAENYTIKVEEYQNDESIWPLFAQSMEFTPKYRGKKLIQKQEMAYDNALKQYVSVYRDSDNNNSIVYGYNKSVFSSGDQAFSFIVNGTKFTSSNAWKQKEKKTVEIVTLPSFEDQPYFNVERTSLIKFIAKDNFLFNAGIGSYASNIGNIVKDDIFIFRVKCKKYDYQNTSLYIPDYVKIKFEIKTYKLDSTGNFSSNTKFEKILMSGETLAGAEYLDPDGYLIGFCKSKNAISQKELQNGNYGIFISADSSETFYLEDVQMFRCVLDSNGNLCLPGGMVLNYKNNILQEQELGAMKEQYYYYYPSSYESEQDISYLFIGEENERFTPVYDNTYEKIRSITQSETNRLNLLQELSEIFECWCRFDIRHKNTGEILLGKDLLEDKIIYAGDASRIMNNSKIYSGGFSFSQEEKTLLAEKTFSPYRQLKFVTFHKNIGQENGAGFVYGINLNAIKRNLDSNDLVTKLIVKDNNNKFAKNGICSISRGKENPSGERTLYDFSYYINQGILKYEDVYNDLYSEEEGWIGLYSRLKPINTQSQELIELQVALYEKLTTLSSDFQTTELNLEKNKEQLREAEEEFYETTLVYYDNMLPNNSWSEENKVKRLGQQINGYRTSILQLEKTYARQQNQLKQIEEELSSIQNQINNNNIAKEKIIQSFENKYNRFIQEAPWHSEDYVDDDLYYIDAQSTLCNSSRPKVSYDISVVEISQIKGYENYSFQLGDITSVEDGEFFGYINGQPKKERVVITEQLIKFEEPEQNSIKVQNYRTQFEDLFQRLAASTQKVEFYSGSYDKVSNIINSDSSVKAEFLTQALSQNSAALSNINNQSVTWDDKGITTKNLTNPNELVRVTSGGIFLTLDGGETWTTGITANGINAKVITAGQINTELITIINGNQPAFRWDASGLNAYQKETSGQFNNKNFVRFDQYGIYGIQDAPSGFAPQSENEVWEKANFALTWRGFLLRKKNQYGSIIIDSERDISLLDKQENELIHMGYLDEYETYGIKISDDQGGTALIARQGGLSVGGWDVKDGEISATFYSDTGSEKRIRLLSKDSDSPITVKLTDIEEGAQYEIEKKDWRIVVDGEFGVDSDGIVYAEELYAGAMALGSLADRIIFTRRGLIRQVNGEVASFRTWESLLES